MPRLTALLVAGFLAAGSQLSLAHSPAAESADNLSAIVRFVDAHRLDASDAVVNDPDAVLGSKEDQHVYRVAKGIPAQYQHLKKSPQGKGWYYLASLRDFSATERDAAKVYAAEFWTKLQPAFEAQGFQIRKDNPWDNFTMTKTTADGVLQVWLDFSEAADGTHVTLRVSPNVG